jgi:hypothetical protein
LGRRREKKGIREGIREASRPTRVKDYRKTMKSSMRWYIDNNKKKKIRRWLSREGKVERAKRKPLSKRERDLVCRGWGGKQNHYRRVTKRQNNCENKDEREREEEVELYTNDTYRKK